jgi:hypothetical protein
LSDIIGAIKPRRMTWRGHMVCLEEMRNVYGFLMGRVEGRDRLVGISIDGRVIIK